MLNKLASEISQYYIDKNKIDKEQKEMYTYCFEILMSTIFNLLIVIILGVVFKLYIETICFIISFMSLRGSVGGYHAKTHIGCLLNLIITFIGVFLFLNYVPINIIRYIAIVSAVIGWTIILLLAPVDSPNKMFDIKEKKKFRKKSLIIIHLVLIPFVILTIFDKTLTYSFTIAYVILVVSISVMIGYLQNYFKREKSSIKLSNKKSQE